MSAADRNKILIAGGIAVVAIIVIVFFLRGRGRQAGPAGFGAPTAQTAAGGGPGSAPAPGQTTPAAPGGVAGAGGGAVGTQAAAPGVPGATQIAQAPPGGGLYVPGTPIRMGSGAAEPSRPDPFLTFEAPPQPVPPEVTSALPPVVLQQGGIRPPNMPEGARGPLGRRRVAGLLFNDGAWAILEQENQSFIVKPGDVVDGNRITAIEPDSIFVTDAEGKRWRVNLRPLAQSAGAAVASSSVPGMPEAPPEGQE